MIGETILHYKIMEKLGEPAWRQCLEKNNDERYQSAKELFSNDFGVNTIRPFEEIPGMKYFIMLKSEDSGNSRNSLKVILNWNE